MLKNSIQKLNVILFSASLFFLFVNIINAQSGRRIPEKSKPAVAEISIPEPKTEPTPTKLQTEPLYKIKVFSNIRSSYSSRFVIPERMHRWVFDRLTNSQLLDVSMGSYASLGEAKKIAKSSNDTFIVLVELDESDFPSPSRQGNSRGEMTIKYFVLSPETGNIKFTGSVYVHPAFVSGRAQGINQNRLCYPEISGDSLYLLEASIETAERILTKFKLPIPPYQCSTKI